MSSEAAESKQPRPGRVRGAWAVLRGSRLVPEQIEWEWLEYKERFNALFDKFNAALARQAKALDRELAPPSREMPAPLSDKAALRTHVARARGIGGAVALVVDEEEAP